MKKLQSKGNSLFLNHKKICVTAILMFFITVALSFYWYRKISEPLQFLSSLSEKQQIALGRVIGDAYQNIYGYKTVCNSENVALVKYPEAYKKFMHENLELLNKILAKDDLDIESAIYLFLPYTEMQIINNLLYRELRNIADSDEKGISSACMLFEDQAEKIAFGLAKISQKKYDNNIKSILE